MDPKRLDLIIDQELRSALSVVPSADFAARVHRRLADQPRPVLFPWRWLALAGMAVAAIVMAIGVAFMRPSAPEVRTSARSVPAPDPVRPRIPSPAQPPARVGAAVTIRRTQIAVRDEVETIVPPGQADAIRQFARNLSEMSVSSRQLPRLVEVFEGELPQVPSYNEKRDER